MRGWEREDERERMRERSFSQVTTWSFFFFVVFLMMMFLLYQQQQHQQEEAAREEREREREREQNECKSLISVSWSFFLLFLCSGPSSDWSDQLIAFCLVGWWRCFASRLSNHVTDFLLCLKCCCSWVIACFQFRIIALCSPKLNSYLPGAHRSADVLCSSRWWQAQRLALDAWANEGKRWQAMTWIKYPRGGFGIGQRRRRHVRLSLFGCDCNSSRERERADQVDDWWLVKMVCEYSTPSPSSPSSTSTIIIMMEMMINSSTTSTTITSRIMSQLLIDDWSLVDSIERERERADQVDD